MINCRLPCITAECCPQTTWLSSKPWGLQPLSFRTDSGAFRSVSRTGSEECEERVTVQVWVPGRISEQVPERCGAGSRLALPPQSPYAFGLGALVPFGRIFVLLFRAVCSFLQLLWSLCSPCEASSFQLLKHSGPFLTVCVFSVF